MTWDYQIRISPAESYVQARRVADDAVASICRIAGYRMAGPLQLDGAGDLSADSFQFSAKLEPPQ